MNDKILEILLDIQSEIKEVSKKVDKIEYQMKDGFETLELLNDNNIKEINKTKVQVSKLEKRISEMNMTN